MSIQQVRNYHTAARVSLQAASNRDGDHQSVKVSQYDMALVQSGFIGPICMYPWQFGISCKDEELDDYRYFWRVIGYVLGIDDQFNMCGGTLHETKSLSKEIEQRVVVPRLARMEAYYLTLSNDFIDGMKLLYPILGKEWLYAFVFPLMRLSQPKLSWKDWFVLRLFKINFWLLRNCSLYKKYLQYFVMDDLKRLEKFIFERIDF